MEDVAWRPWSPWPTTCVITIGIYALSGFEVTPATVTGVLTILGFSLYDTVVVFDKVRENTKNLRESHQTYAEAANLAVNQTLVRSINTSIVALIPVGAILYVGAVQLGSGPLKDLALALFVGMAAGAYSSIFIATPLLAHMKSRGVRRPGAGEAGQGASSPRGRPLRLRAGVHRGHADRPRTRTRRPGPAVRRSRLRRRSGGNRPLPDDRRHRPRTRRTAAARSGAAELGERAGPADAGSRSPSGARSDPVRHVDAAELLRGLVVDVPDFPEPGVVFKDITPDARRPGRVRGGRRGARRGRA